METQSPSKLHVEFTGAGDADGDGAEEADVVDDADGAAVGSADAEAEDEGTAVGSADDTDDAAEETDDADTAEEEAEEEGLEVESMQILSNVGPETHLKPQVISAVSESEEGYTHS